MDISSSKPTVKIKDCFIFANRLYGIPENHPSYLVSGTRTVRTTEIQKTIINELEPDIIETKNTVYKVLNYISEKEFEKILSRLYW